MEIDCQFDGLPGPTHNYSGMSHGNVASARHAGRASNPREAALQGLAKMRAVASRGFPQAVLPPQERPHLPTLRSLGFGGSDADVLARAARDAPSLLSASSSAAAMWTANAATVSPSADTADGRVHFTPANLASLLHRSIEAPTTTRILRAIFADEARFVVHGPLPAAAQTADEGAANHTRLAGPGERDAGVELFVHGRSAYDLDAPSPHRYPARQTREACEAIARRHGVDPTRTVHAQQHPGAIDAGVFHNDVIAVGQGRTLLVHERAWTRTRETVDTLAALVGAGFRADVVTEAELPLADAVASYLFNSALLERPDGGLLLIAASDARENARASAVLDRWSAPGGPVTETLVLDLRQSMRNGGGPACLRLRVPLTAEERTAIRPRVFLDQQRFTALDAWVRRHYRDRLLPADLADPALLDESRRALDELTRILALPSIYDFQLAGR